jgi:hypothetical protein
MATNHTSSDVIPECLYVFVRGHLLPPWTRSRAQCCTYVGTGRLRCREASPARKQVNDTLTCLPDSNNLRHWLAATDLRKEVRRLFDV